MKKVFLSLITIFMILSLSIVLVKANTKTSVVIEEGVQIRTDGNNGLKWVANVTNHKDSNVYGFLFAQGELNEVTIDTTDVINQVVEGVTSEEPVMSATMTKFPKSSANQDISVVAYVKDGDTYTYSNVIVRNLAEVALGAKNKALEGTFINDVIDYVADNYMKTYNIGDSIFINNALYETNPVEIEKLFVEDWNKKFGTNWIEIDYSTFRASAADGSSPLKETGDANCSGTNMYEFFNTDTVTSSKWKWLIEYMIGVAGGKVHPLRQANALLGDGTKSDTYGSGMQNFMHLAASITNFFNGGSSRDANNDIVFNDSKYSKIEEYNKKIYSINPILIKINNNLLLKPLTSSNGYYFEGYLNEENLYVNSYTITSKSLVLVPSYKTITYSIKYLYDSEELLLSPSQYTIEDKDIMLPKYEKTGYAFKGWYTTSNFEEGTKIDKIVAGSFGDKVLYAKLEKTSNVPVQVTYDLNGGYFDGNHYLDKYDTTDFIGGAYNAITWAQDEKGNYVYTHYISLGTTAREWWYHVTLNETTIPGIYEVTGRGSSGSTKATIDCDIAILYADLHKTALPELFTLCSELKTGQLVAISNIPAVATTSASINVNVFDQSLTLAKFAEDLTVEYTLPTPLLQPINPGRKFEGWKSSLDGSIVTEFPGYTSNPGNITYTAQWKSDNDINITIDLNGGYWTDSSVIENNLEGDPAITANIVRYTGNYYGYSDEGVLFGDISIMPLSSTMKFSHRIGLKKIDGVYQIVQIIASGSIEEFNQEVEYVLYAAEGKANINSFKSKCSLGDIIVFNKPITGLTKNEVVSITANLYSKDQFDKAKEKSVSMTVEAPYQINYDFKHSSLKFVGWYDNPEGNGEGLSSITKAGTVYAVWSSYIVVKYDTDPFTEAGKSIQLNAEIVGNLSGNFVWESLDSTIATVDQTGKVTGVKEGTVDIKVYDSGDPSVNLTINISVVSAGLSELFSILSDAHNDTIYTKYNLGIGAGTPEYYTDIYGSVSKILFNQSLNIDKTFANDEVTNATGDYYTLKSLEFITVHYTGNMAKGADAYANAQYFASDNSVSIHYTTGNDGVYQALTHDKGAMHAGDSASIDQVGHFEWIPTGVAYDDCDLLHINWSASNDFYFEINGKKTTIKLPSTWDYKGKYFSHTDHIFNPDGTISSNSSYTGTKFSNRAPESFFNDWGFPVKVVNGEYYMGKTWWCYSQVGEGRICANGGNYNSIGIESCVDKGSDLWYTWQLTAKLVAKLCYDNNLGLERIRPHHAYTAKDCPQPMLENNLEIWWEFIELVRYEYELLTKFSNYTITFTSNNPDYISNTGRIIKYTAKDTTVSYTLTITDKTTSKSNSVTYFSTIPGSK